MKKLFLTLALALMVVLLRDSDVKAGNSENVTIAVSVIPNLSVNLPAAKIDLGEVTVGSTTVSATPIIIKNDGSGLAEKFTLSCSSFGNWKLGTTPDAETFVLNAAFSEEAGSASWTAVDSVISDVVAYNDSRKLWFQFKAPTSTATTTRQEIIVIVTAQLP